MIFVWHARATARFLKNLLRNKQAKTGRKIIHEWKVFCLNCDVEDCKHCIPFQNVQKFCEETEDCTLSVIDLNEPCIVAKVECRKLLKFLK